MSIGTSILAVVGIAGGAVGTVSMLVFLAAGAANSSPAQVIVTKRWMLGLLVFGLLSFGGAIVAWVNGRPLLAAGVGAAPAAFMILSGAYLAIKGG